MFETKLITEQIVVNAKEKDIHVSKINVHPIKTINIYNTFIIGKGGSIILKIAESKAQEIAKNIHFLLETWPLFNKITNGV